MDYIPVPVFSLAGFKKKNRNFPEELINKWWVNIIITFSRLIFDMRSFYKILTHKLKKNLALIYIFIKEILVCKIGVSQMKYQSPPGFAYIACDGIFCLQHLKG